MLLCYASARMRKHDKVGYMAAKKDTLKNVEAYKINTSRGGGAYNNFKLHIILSCNNFIVCNLFFFSIICQSSQLKNTFSFKF